jgi:hypothetical protein
VELEITPEPTPDERAAIEAAVAEVLARDSTGVNPWWQDGSVAADDAGDFPTSPPGP